MMIREIHNHKPSFFNFRTNEIAKDILYSFVVPFFSAYIHSHIFVNVQPFISVNSNGIHPTKNASSH